MKYLKMLSIAAVAAMALMAFVGAGTASATVFCHTTESPCPQKWTKGTEVEFRVKSGTTALWKAPNEETVVKTCTDGEIEGEISNEGGEAGAVMLSVPASGFEWKNCTQNTFTTEGGELEFQWIEGTDNATVTMKGFQFTTNSLFFGSCTYSAGSGVDLGVLTGSGTGDAVIDINARLPVIKGPPTCCKEVVWTEEFTLEKPQNTALYVRKS